MTNFRKPFPDFAAEAWLVAGVPTIDRNTSTELLDVVSAPIAWVPHLLQNFALIANTDPHFVQNRRGAADSEATPLGAPHLVQKAFVSSTGLPHLAHVKFMFFLPDANRGIQPYRVRDVVLIS
jgi:hypothetical protein